MKIAKEEQFSKILDEFRSNIRSLMKHKEASEVVEFGYKLASPLQRCQLMEEFYGAEFALFKVPNEMERASLFVYIATFFARRTRNVSCRTC